MAKSSVSQGRIPRKLRIRQTRATNAHVIGADFFGRQKVHRPRRADNVVLIDSVAAYSNRADHHPIAVKRKAAGENRNAVGEVWIDREVVGKHDAVQDVCYPDRNPKQGIQSLKGVKPWQD